MSPAKQTSRATSKRQVKSNAKTANIPMAYVKRPRRKQTRVSTDLNRIIVSGRDLVVPTPRSLPVGASQTSVFQCIPANPIFWSGTRVSRQASMYQVYRPRKFLVHYKPQVAVTNPGLVVYGTLFQDATVTAGELQQVLNTSNGGGISPCYHSFSSRVDLRALQLRQFNVVGNPASTDNVPFLWVATYSGYAPSAISTSTAPGWVEVEWEFEFMSGNPGTGNTGRGIFTSDEQDIVSYSRARSTRGLRAFDWNFPFGVPLGIIKEIAKPLLRHVGAVLLNGAESTSWRYGIGKILTWVSDSLRTSRASGTTLLRDDDGSTIELPDDTPVIILMCGLPQPEETAPTPERIPFEELIVQAVFNTDNQREVTWHLRSEGEKSEQTNGIIDTIDVSTSGSRLIVTCTTGTPNTMSIYAQADEWVLLQFVDGDNRAVWYQTSSLYEWTRPGSNVEVLEQLHDESVPTVLNIEEEEVPTVDPVVATHALTRSQRTALESILAQH